MRFQCELIQPYIAKATLSNVRLFYLTVLKECYVFCPLASIEIKTVEAEFPSD